MQKGLFAWLFYTAISFHSIYLYGQSFPAPAVEVFVEFKGDSIVFDPDDSLATYANDSIAVILLVTVPEGADVATVHVRAGSSEGGSQLIEKSFAHNGPFDQGGGATYRRAGKHVYLGLGRFHGVAEIHAQVWLEQGNGSLSDVRTVKQAHK